MPKALDDCIAALKAKGHSVSSAFAICTDWLQKSGVLQPGTQKLGRKGSTMLTKGRK